MLTRPLTYNSWLKTRLKALFSSQKQVLFLAWALFFLVMYRKHLSAEWMSSVSSLSPQTSALWKPSVVKSWCRSVCCFYKAFSPVWYTSLQQMDWQTERQSQRQIRQINTVQYRLTERDRRSAFGEMQRCCSFTWTAKIPYGQNSNGNNTIYYHYCLCRKKERCYWWWETKAKKKVSMKAKYFKEEL